MSSFRIRFFLCVLLFLPMMVMGETETMSDCLNDSILSVNSQGQVIEKTYLSYDDKGRVTLSETMVWQNNGWIGKQKSETQYDEKGRKVLTATYAWKDGEWQGTNQQTKLFNPDGTQKEITTYIYADRQWKNDTKQSYEYDGAKNITLSLKEQWNATTQTWQPLSKQESRFDAEKHKLEDATYVWNNDEWVGVSKTTKTYNTNSKLIEETSYTWRNSQWVGKTRKTTTYNEQGQVTEEADFVTNASGEWVAGKTKTTYAYNADKLCVEKIVYKGKNGVWEESTKDVNEYDTKKHIILTETYSWASSYWAGISRYTYVYTSNLVTEKYAYQWDNDNRQWVFYSKQVYSYDKMGNTSMIDSYGWATADWSLYSRQRYDHTYNEAGKQTSYAAYDWGDDYWVCKNRTDYDYDALGNTILEIVYTGRDSIWREYSMMEYAYDSLSRQTLTIRYLRDGSTWKGDYRYVYVYNSQGQQIEVERYNWKNNTWSGLVKSQTIYDDSTHQKKETILYTWSGGVWMPAVQTAWDYDTEGRTIYEQSATWSGQEWISNAKTHHVYDDLGRHLLTESYALVDEQWFLTAKDETAYNSLEKMAYHIEGTWENGVETSYQEKRYSYHCGYDYVTLDSTIICQGDSAQFSRKYYRVAGTYRDTVRTVNFIDSITTWSLYVNPTSDTAVAVTIYADALPYPWHGDSLVAAGKYIDTLVNRYGCDSVVRLSLTVLPVVRVEVRVVDTICPSSVYPSRLGQRMVSGDTAWVDSVRTRVDDVPTDSFYCYRLSTYRVSLPKIGQGSIQAYCGQPLDVSRADEQIERHVSSSALFAPNRQWRWEVKRDGQWKSVDAEPLTSQRDSVLLRCVLTADCDLWVADSLVLTIQAPIVPTDTLLYDTVYADVLPYSWHGQVLTRSGKYVDTLANRYRCDSVVTLYFEVLPVARAQAEVRDTLCPGSLYSSRWQQVAILHDTVWVDSVRTRVGEVPTDSFYRYVLTTYRVSLPAIPASSIRAVCGKAVDYSLAMAIVDESLASQPLLVPECKVEWQIWQGGHWVPIPLGAIDARLSEVTVRCIAHGDCACYAADSVTVAVEAQSANNTPSLDHWNAVSLYDNHLLMLDKASLESETEWAIASSDVSWYKVRGELDRGEDIDSFTEKDEADEFMGYGYYLSAAQPFVGQYYALIYHASRVDTECDATARTVVVDCTGSLHSAPALKSSSVRSSDEVTILHLLPTIETQISVYDMGGKLFCRYVSSGQDSFSFPASQLTGVYLIELQCLSSQETNGQEIESYSVPLRYMVY